MNVASFVISADREKWFLLARLCRLGARSRGLNTERLNCFYINDLAWYYCILSSAESVPGIWDEAWQALHGFGCIGIPGIGGSNPSKNKGLFGRIRKIAKSD
jgi:hypothetical protein